MATARKRLEEQNLKTLRELTALPHNKKCLECQQRGTTYADMTTAGFVCTQCSGYLRGLNPPHRIKSISMTTFSEEEIKHLKEGGNEVSSATWMARWNPRRDRDPDKKDEVAFKEFLITKYERKHWYCSPAELKKETKESPKPEPKLQPPPSSKSERARLGSLTSPQTTPSHTALPPTSTITATAQAGGGGGSGKVDLLGDLGNDPFAPRPPVGGVSVLPSGPMPQLRPKSDEFGAFTGAGTAASTIQPVPNAVGGLSSTQSLQPTGSAGTSADDRYAALASLDQTLRSIKVEDPPPQPAQQQQHAQTQQNQPFGGGFVGGAVNPFGGAPNAQLGTALGPAQQQSNPFLVGQTAPGMQQPGQVVGGFGGQQVTGGGLGTFQGMGQPGGGFPGQIAPAQQQASFGGQPQQFGAFGQQPRPGGQWGQQVGFNPAAQGPQMQWRAQQQQQSQGAVPQQQQWGAQVPQQTQFAGQQGGFGFRSGVSAQSSGSGSGGSFGTVNMQRMPGQSSGGSFGSMNVQQASHQQPQQQFGGFVSAGQPQQPPQQQQHQQQQQQQQQQQKPAAQFNWSPSVPQKTFTQSSPSSVDTGWSSGLNKAAPSSTWGLQQQPTSSSAPTGWSSNMFGGGSVTMQAGGFSQSGTSAGGFNQPSMSGSGGFNQSSMGGSGFNQSSMGAGGFNQPSMGAGGFNQPSMSGSGFNQSSMGGSGFNQPSMSAGGFNQPSMGGSGFNQSSMGAGGFNQPSMSAGGFNQPSMGTGGFNQLPPGGGGGLQNWNQQPTMQPQMQRQPMGGFGSGGGQQPFMSSHPAGQNLSSNPFASSSQSQTNPFL